MPIQLDHVAITIAPNGLPLAKIFYCEILGFEEIPRPPELAGLGLWLKVGKAQLHMTVENFPERTETIAHQAYLVEGLNEMVEKLEKNGFLSSNLVSLNGYRRLKIRDPFGNRVEFLEKLNP